MRRYVLKNLVRDWGSEGAAERAQSYGRIVAELRSRYQVCAHMPAHADKFHERRFLCTAEAMS